jgi:hypothetical protein
MPASTTLTSFNRFPTSRSRSVPSAASPGCGGYSAPGPRSSSKGSGFYQTDYRSESYKQGAKAEEAAQTSKSDTSDKSGKADSNGAAKGAATTAPASKATGKSAGKNSKST